MEKVPKIVEERLKAKAVAVDHPDADMLTAFSERALPERERAHVLEHLARCGECRDVIALSLPAEEPAVAMVRPVRGRWLTWPQLRWGLAAAGVIVVGSFGLLRYREASHPAMVASYKESTAAGVTKAKNEIPPSPAAPGEARYDEQKKAPIAGLPDSPAKTGTASEQGKEFDRLEQFAKLQGASRNKQADGRVGLRTQSLPHGPKPPAQQWQQNAYANSNNNAYAYQTQVPGPAVPPAFARPQASNQVVVSAQAAPTSGAVAGGPIHGERKIQDLDTLTVAGKSSIELQRSGSNAGAEVARAKPAEPPANAPTPQAPGAYDVSTADGSNFSQLAVLAPESARWSINALGGLQRSTDQGKTWQDVDVSLGSAASRGANLQYALKSSREKALAKDKDKTDAKEAGAIVFRAVSANGPDVWAGGSSGVLYHSTDAGGHWVRVIPSWSGVELTDDIISLQFADPQRGRILTSSSEIWTTADAGQTWQKH